MACKRWTQPDTERWAEAVQNEIDDQIEGISNAIPEYDDDEMEHTVTLFPATIWSRSPCSPWIPNVRT